MKKLRTLLTILFLSLVLIGMTSCEMSRRSESGRHRDRFERHDNDNQRHDDHDNGQRPKAVIIIDKDNR